mgnify:CR=1 FL=1|jgi:hypothetical protein
MGVKNLQGEATHLTTLSSGEEGRRDKRICFYNDNGICKCVKVASYTCACMGSTHCPGYHEKVRIKVGKKPEPRFTFNSPHDPNTKRIYKSPNRHANPKPKEFGLRPGLKVLHKVYGEGEIKSLIGQDVVVQFDKGRKFSFGYQVVLQWVKKE